MIERAKYKTPKIRPENEVCSLGHRNDESFRCPVKRCCEALSNQLTQKLYSTEFASTQEGGSDSDPAIVVRTATLPFFHLNRFAPSCVPIWRAGVTGVFVQEVTCDIPIRHEFIVVLECATIVRSDEQDGVTRSCL